MTEPATVPDQSFKSFAANKTQRDGVSLISNTTQENLIKEIRDHICDRVKQPKIRT